MPNSRRPGLLVINQYYKPDFASTGQLAAEICESLAEAGFDVHVITGQPSYTAESPVAPDYEVLEGVHVHRVDLGRNRGRENMRTRIAGYLGFLRKAWRKARQLTKAHRFTNVVTFHNPPFVGLIGGHLARHDPGIAFTYILYDIHPDVLQATGWMRLPSPAVWLWERLNQAIFKRAQNIIVLSEGMKQTLVEEKGVKPGKVASIPLWGRPELDPRTDGQQVREELGIGPEEILLLYSGNMGVMHPLDPILDAAADLAGKPVRFLFVGDGTKRPALAERTEREGLSNVHFLPFQPEERFGQIVAAADACFVALEAGLERLALPSRAFTFLSGGRPLINLMDPKADLARIAEDGGCGWTVTSGAELTQLVQAWLGDPEKLETSKERAIQVYNQRFKRDQVIREYERVLGQPETA